MTPRATIVRGLRTRGARTVVSSIILLLQPSFSSSRSRRLAPGARRSLRYRFVHPTRHALKGLRSNRATGDYDVVKSIPKLCVLQNGPYSPFRPISDYRSSDTLSSNQPDSHLIRPSPGGHHRHATLSHPLSVRKHGGKTLRSTEGERVPSAVHAVSQPSLFRNRRCSPIGRILECPGDSAFYDG